jgi:3-hydroxyisobutyrate dehydrogenase
METPRIAFFGLGAMGSGMVRRLLKAGFPVTIYNRTADKAEPFRGEGALLAGSPREAAANADVVISMVADDTASGRVWLGEGGAMEGVRAGAILIESSTLSVEWVRRLAAEASSRGCELLDAPVTGSKPQAAAGELCFIVGGDAARPREGAAGARGDEPFDHPHRTDRERGAAEADQQFSCAAFRSPRWRRQSR